MRDIPLRNKKSVNQGNSVFTMAELADYKKQAEKLNSEGRGDAAAFFVTRAPVA
jgi:hypothetical protein